MNTIENRLEINRRAKELQEKLKSIDLPSHLIHCYGSQIVIECKGEESIKKWSGLISKFSNVRKIINTILETNSGYVKGYRLYATIQ